MMALRTSADNAEDVAAGFRRFREPLPEHATEITGLIADLYTISSSLKTLGDLSQSRLYRQNLPLVRADLELVSASLKLTLEDIVNFFGDLEERRGATRDVFKQTWIDLCSFFLTESQEALSTRLARYKVFLKDLEDLIKNKYHDTTHLSHLREGFKMLLIQQDGRLALRLGALSMSSQSSSSSNSMEPSSPVSDRRPRYRRSYERARPSRSSPQTPTSPSSGSFMDIPPMVPDAPGSPVTSSATSHSFGSNTLGEHWAKRVFLEERSMTPLPPTGESSKCLGDPMSELKPWLREQGFEELIQLAFLDSIDFRVYFYLREDDHRARIVCKYSRTSKSSEYYCLPLNLLEIIRVGSSCLQLCRRRRGGQELVVWANLKFSSIEEMVYFFCIFLALRSQDSGRPVDRIRDYELEEEEELFGGQIIDDDFLHALRVYRDKFTGAIRLQASVHKGEMKRAPVWTAFITDNLRTRGWLRRVDPRVVVLRELRRSIFTFPEYNPPRTPKGEHILRFANRADAEVFVEIMTELANSRVV